MQLTRLYVGDAQDGVGVDVSELDHVSKGDSSSESPLILVEFSFDVEVFHCRFNLEQSLSEVSFEETQTLDVESVASDD